MSLFGDGRREGLLAVLALLLVTIAAHAPGLLGAGTRSALAPTTLEATGAAQTGESSVNQTIVLPSLQTAGDVARGNELPLWNPNARFGEPFSVSGAPLFYPPFWLLMLPDGPRWLELVLMLHGFLASMLGYRFLRAIGLSRYVAFIGGGAWGVGWFVTAQGDRLPELAATAWMPFALETTWRVLVTRDRARWGGWMAIALALPFLTGGMSTAVLTVICCVAMVVAHFHILERSERGHAARTLGVATALAACIAAPVILDWAQNLPHLDASERVTTQLRPGGLLALTTPAFGTALAGHGPTGLGHLSPGADPLSLALYPGAAVLFLLVLGLFRTKHRATEVFWTLVAGLGLLLTVAGPTADALVPALGRILAPGGALVLTHLAAIVLAATALENFLDNPLKRSWAAPLTAGLGAATLILVLVVAVLVPTLAARALGWIADESDPSVLLPAVHGLRVPLLLTTGSLAAIGGAFLVWRRLGVLRFKTVLAALIVVELLATVWFHTPRHSGDAIPVAVAGPRREGRTILTTRADRPGSWRAACGERVLNTPGNGMLDRTADLLDEVDPLWVHRTHRASVAPLTFAPLVDHPVLRRAGIEQAISRGPLFTEEFVAIPAAPGAEGALATSAGGIAHTDRTLPAKRARLVFDVDFAESPDHALELLRTKAARRNHAVVEGEPTEVTAPTADTRLIWLEDRANRVMLRCENGDGNGYLLLADAWAPGWVAKIDGRTVPVLHGDYAFRAVAVPAGTHTVTFEYRPWILRYGWIAMLTGLVLALAWRTGRSLGRFRPPSYA